MPSTALTDYDKEHGAEDRLQASADFDGPVKSRSCTDPLCIVLLIVVWLITFGVAIWSMNNGGDPRLLVYPTDYKGRLCGDTNESFLLNDVLGHANDLLSNVDEIGDILASDENETTINNGTLISENKTVSLQLPPYWYMTDIIFNGVCMPGCPKKTNLEPEDKADLICKEEADIKNLTQCLIPNTDDIIPDPNVLVFCGACMYMLESKPFLWRCVASNTEDIEIMLFKLNATASSLGPEYADMMEKINTAIDITSSYLVKFVNDVYVASDIILTLGFAGSSFLGFLVLYILRIPGLMSLMVWIAALLTPALVATGGFFSYFVADDYVTDLATQYMSQSDLIKTLQITAYVLWALAAILVCVLIYLRKRINLAIGITKAAAHAVSDLPFSVFYPIIQSAFYMIMMVPWACICMYLASMREGVPDMFSIGDFYHIYYVKYTWSTTVFYWAWYMLFVLFWSSEFILAIGQLTLALNFSKWYFTAEKGGGIKTGLLGAMCTATFKHAGTAAFGALLIAIVRWIRAVVMYVYKKLKQANMDSPLVKAAMCCCQCMLCCVERCMKFINKNAYIQTAVFGYSFCKAAREAFFLILRNAARMFAMGVVSELAIIFCKMFVVLGIGISGFFACQLLYGDYLFSPLGIAVFISIIAWFIADMFLGVFGIAISTILQCFVADEEMYPQGSYYVPDELDSFLKQIESKQ